MVCALFITNEDRHYGVNKIQHVTITIPWTWKLNSTSKKSCLKYLLVTCPLDNLWNLKLSINEKREGVLCYVVLNLINFE